MQTLTARTIKAKRDLQTKTLFWLLFVGSRGGTNRIRIMSVLRKRPSNRNQLSTELCLEYKGIQHHLNVLEENNLVKKIGIHYGVTYYVSELFMHNEITFNEIRDKLKIRNEDYVF